MPKMKKTWGLVLAGVLLIMGTWEGYWRMQGFRPVIEDDRKLWHLIRSRVNDSTQAVIIGASRIQLGFHPDVFAENTGIVPKILAIDGNAPFSVMKDLADDPQFKGTLFCSIHPRWIAESFPRKDRAAKWVRKYRSPTLLSRVELHLSLVLQETFVFRYPGLSLDKLKQRYEQRRWPPRPAYSILRRDRYREAHFTAENTPKIYASRVKRVREITAASTVLDSKAFIEQVKEIQSYADKIRSRGGQVIYIRMPSSGEVRTLEDRVWPRKRYWNRFVETISGTTIHFEDHASLSGFICPDGSHLSVADAKRFTAKVLAILENEKQVRFR